LAKRTAAGRGPSTSGRARSPPAANCQALPTPSSARSVRELGSTPTACGHCSGSASPIRSPGTPRTSTRHRHKRSTGMEPLYGHPVNSRDFGSSRKDWISSTEQHPKRCHARDSWYASLSCSRSEKSVSRFAVRLPSCAPRGEFRLTTPRHGHGKPRTPLSESDTAPRHTRHCDDKVIRLLRGSLEVPVSRDRRRLDGVSRTLIPDRFGMTMAVQ
jgi:hypothetical protein